MNVLVIKQTSNEDKVRPYSLTANTSISTNTDKTEMQ
uniref:Uncharacterized protein n=1 Tax=Arundo donax TaxID=35708 RepID=A0A0A9AN00_ARUDO